MADVPKYKRRTFDECMAIALNRFDSEAGDHLSFEHYEHCLTEACLGGGALHSGWVAKWGFEPELSSYYEISICDWAESESRGSPSPKCWIRILVSRDRESDFCSVWWHPDSD